MLLERREGTPLFAMLLAPVGAVIAALTISSVLISFTDVPVFDAYGRLAIFAFGSRLAITETLVRATPLILTGLSVAIAFRAQIWNIGAEGQLYVGALAGVAAGSNLTFLPPALLIPLIIFAGAISGMLLLLGPVLLRLKLGVDETVVTLLLNFIVLLFVRLMVDGPMKDPLAFGWPQSVPVPEIAMLHKLIPGTRLHAGLLIAAAAAFVVWIVQRWTVFGLESRAVGTNPAAANFAGIPVSRVALKVAALSGGLAGLAGVVEVIGVKGFASTDLSPGYGYTAIIIAMLAALHPLGVVLAAVFVASIFIGADGMSRSTGIPSFIADVILATSLIAMLLALLLVRYRVRR